MTNPDDDKTDPGSRWLTTLSWPDKVIARCFPRFFERHAPDELKEQWVNYLEKKQGRKKDAPSRPAPDAKTRAKSDAADTAGSDNDDKDA